MRLLLLCLVIHGFGYSPWWYVLAVLLWLIVAAGEVIVWLDDRGEF
jgi:hypothetical protein